MNPIWMALTWTLFFATSVYGHVAIKVATRAGEGTRDPVPWLQRAGELAANPWTLSGVAAWCVSGVVWVAILEKSSLSQAMSVSALRYGLVILAAFSILGEDITGRQWLGMMLIAAGITLVKWTG